MTYYDILGVPRTAPKDEIKKAYRKLAQDFHPDKLAGVPPAVTKLAEEKFKDVQEAYEILTKHRAEYDNQLQAVGPPSPPPPPPPKARTAAPASPRPTAPPSQPNARVASSAPTPTAPHHPALKNKKSVWQVCGKVLVWVLFGVFLLLIAIIRTSSKQRRR